jgi:hypothetical protein
MPAALFERGLVDASHQGFAGEPKNCQITRKVTTSTSHMPIRHFQLIKPVRRRPVGRPHFGHTNASVEIGFPQSLHSTSDIGEV